MWWCHPNDIQQPSNSIIRTSLVVVLPIPELHALSHSFRKPEDNATTYDIQILYPFLYWLLQIELALTAVKKHVILCLRSCQMRPHLDNLYTGQYGHSNGQTNNYVNDHDPPEM